jgi:hypothetical protein
MLIAFLGSEPYAHSNDFLAPFWGSDISPSLDGDFRASLQLDQFTEFDMEGARFPFGRKSDTCAIYCETIGFNTLQIAKRFRRLPSVDVSMAGFAGAAHDGLTRFLQNDYSHAKNGLPPVPRDGEKQGVLFGVSLEANRAILPGRILFAGGGAGVNNVYCELYAHAGAATNRFFLHDSLFGLKYSATNRAGAALPARESLVAGQRYFRKLSPFHNVTQVEAGLCAKVYGIPIEFSWRGSYSTGIFRNAGGDGPEGMFLEGLKTVIWKFSFERYNDDLNGTDYGPSYGVKATFTN